MNTSGKSANQLNAQRRQAVQLRLAGKTLAEVRAEVGLSTPTIVAAVKAFKAGGWPAVDVKPRGRPKRSESTSSLTNHTRSKLLKQFLITPDLWTTSSVRDWLKSDQKIDVSVQTTASYLHGWDWLPPNQQRLVSASNASACKTWLTGEYEDFKSEAKVKRASLLWIDVRSVNADFIQIFAHTLRGRGFWACFEKPPTRAQYQHVFAALLNEFPAGIALVTTNSALETEANRFAEQTDAVVVCTLAPFSGAKESHVRAPSTISRQRTDAGNIAGPNTLVTRQSNTGLTPRANRSATQVSERKAEKKRSIASRSNRITHATPNNKPNLSFNQAVTGRTMTASPISTSQPSTSSAANDAHRQAATSSSQHSTALPNSEDGLTHLQQLESESIQIMREVVAEAENPVMLYSAGKDSAVMTHLARKAFFPANPPFPLLHVDTTWKFQEMYRFRDTVIKEQGFELLTHTNPEGVEKGVNPFTHGSALHTDIMKTDALKQALDKHGFDIAIGGARRDEEKSRAKERIFSFRNAQHRWEPKNQRPELWNLYNTRKQPGESIRAFPLSNWTELDIWQYIHLQNIPIVPLYFSAERPVVDRDGSLIMVDDERMPLHEGEVPMMRHVRFRTLGCYPLTGAVESAATTLPEIIQEMLLATSSERQGRLIDSDSAASMEKKKQQGYF